MDKDQDSRSRNSSQRLLKLICKRSCKGKSAAEKCRFPQQRQLIVVIRWPLVPTSTKSLQSSHLIYWCILVGISSPLPPLTNRLCSWRTFANLKTKSQHLQMQRTTTWALWRKKNYNQSWIITTSPSRLCSTRSNSTLRTAPINSNLNSRRDSPKTNLDTSSNSRSSSWLRSNRQIKKWWDRAVTSSNSTRCSRNWIR